MKTIATILLCQIILSFGYAEDLQDSNAKNVSTFEAILVGRVFLESRIRLLNKQALLNKTNFLNIYSINNNISLIIDEKTKDTLAYHINILPEGYMILSNDRRITPIIAYSLKNALDTNNSIFNLYKMVKFDIKLRKKALNDNVYSENQIKLNKDTWNKLLTDNYNINSEDQAWPNEYSGWIDTEWGQGETNGIENDNCPDDPNTNVGEHTTDGRCKTGCVATAMGQIVNYWGNKTKNPSSVSFGTSDDYISEYDPNDGFGTRIINITASDANFTNMTYPVNGNQISSLLFACGVSVSMNYSDNGSGTPTSNVADALRSKFGFNSAEILTSNFYPQIQENIKNGMPVQLAIAKEPPTTDRHSIVCDGYKIEELNNKYHLNFGWNGQYQDVWYSLPDDMPAGYSVIDYVVANIDGSSKLPVSIIVPSQNATNVVNVTPITISFNNELNPNTINNSTFKVYGEFSGFLSGNISIINDNTAIVFNSSNNYKYGEKITVTLTNDITYDNEIHILPFTWQFTTKTNSSSGTFTRRMENFDTIVIGDALDIKAGDFNNDEYVDLMITGGSVSAIHLNNGNGAFPNRKIFNVGGRYSEVSDINNDGNLDLLFANGSLGGWPTWFVALNDGEGNFSTSISNSSHINSFIRAADFNSDGFNDLVIGWGDTRVSILINNGDLTFTETIYDTQYGYTQFGTVSDFDNDGDIDIICSGTYGSVVKVALLQNKGNGEFLLPENSIDVSGGGDGYIFDGDMDNDNDVDFAVCKNYGGTFYGINQSNGVFLSDNSTLKASRGIFKDLDGNGSNNVSWLIADDYGNSYTFRPNNNYKFDYDITNLGVYKHYFTSADFDNDGDLDVAIAGDADRLEIFENNDSPVPIELYTFIGCLTNNKVYLNWQTKTEINNYGFEIQRRIQLNEQWRKIGFVQGNGNSNAEKNYFFIDQNPSSGKIQYRLKQIDTDGSFSFSNVIELFIEAPRIFSLQQNYPNPFNPITTIYYELPIDTYTEIIIFDVLGREVKILESDFKVAGRYYLDIDGSSLSSGIYYYRIKAGDFISVKKMLLIK